MTLKGLSLSLLHFTLVVGNPYDVTANGSAYDSKTNQTSTKVNDAQISLLGSRAFDFRFNDNYTLLTNPPVSLRAVYAAASSNSLPTGAFQGQGSTDLIRVQDYVRAALPSIAGLPSSSDMNLNASKLIYRISYPTWGGTGIKHDPTYVAYYVPHLILSSLPVPFDPTIILYLAVVGIAVAVTAFVVTRALRNRTRNHLQPRERVQQ